MIHRGHIAGFLFFSAIFIVVGLLVTGTSPFDFFRGYRSTTTVTTVTESLRFSTEGQSLSWGLPPGQFAAFGRTSHDGCTTASMEVTCTIETNSRLVIENSAHVTIEIDATEGWTLSIEPGNSNSLSASVMDPDGVEIVSSEQFLNFWTNATPKTVRFPVIATSATLGSNLYETNEIQNVVADYWQPTLRDGNVVIIASKGKARQKYKVLDERLDPGDVVHIGSRDTRQSRSGSNNIVWGMLSVNQGSADTHIEAVLHTSLREILVTRFGAPDGHKIEASSWSIFSRWPAGQAVWIFFISVSVVVTFLMQGTEFLSLLFERSGSDKKTKD